MSGNQNENRPIVSLNYKQVIGIITTAVSLLAGGTVINFSYVEDKVREFARPEINKRVYTVLDSVLSLPKNDFKTELAKEMRLEEDSVVYIISNWYKQEKRVNFLGFYLKRDRVYYKAFDGYSYIPIFDEFSNKYYYINHSGQSIWCY